MRVLYAFIAMFLCVECFAQISISEVFGNIGENIEGVKAKYSNDDYDVFDEKKSIMFACKDYFFSYDYNKKGIINKVVYVINNTSDEEFNATLEEATKSFGVEPEKFSDSYFFDTAYYSVMIDHVNGDTNMATEMK